MPIPTPLTLLGAPGSPYTRKMVALLRYRRIPYRLIVGRHGENRGLPKPKVALLPTFYLPDSSGALEAVVDSTPLIRRFEAEFNERHATPVDPVTAFIDYLLEDYADEWLTKAMFHYRWYYPADIERAGEILPRWTAVTAAEEQMQKSKRFIQQRQIERLYVVGSNDTTAPVIEASYRRFLGHFTRVLEHHPFAMGGRPGASDFALYGQLTQLAQFDPTPMALTLAEAPRVYAWVDIVDDLSGIEVNDADWLSARGDQSAARRSARRNRPRICAVPARQRRGAGARPRRSAADDRRRAVGAATLPVSGTLPAMDARAIRGVVGRRSRRNGRDSQRHRM